MNQPAHPAQSDTSRDAPSTTLPVAYTRPMEEPEGRASGESANGESALGVSGEVFRPVIERFERFLRYEKHRSEETIRSYVSDLEGFFGYVARRGVRHVDSIDASLIREWFGSLHLRRAARSTVARRLLRLEAVVEVLYASGMRISELTGLDLQSIDRVNKTVRVLGKGNKERVVPLGTPALKALNRWVSKGRPQ